MNPDNKRIYIVVLTLITAIMLIASTIFLQVIKRSFLLDAENTLSEIARQCAVAVENKIAGRLDILSSFANLEQIKSAELSNAEKLDLIKREVTRSNFLRIGICGPDGNAITTDQKQFYIGDRAYFIDAIRGEAGVSGSLQDRIDGLRDIAVYSVPVWDSDGNVICIIFATDYIHQLTALINNVYAGPGKEALLVASDGSVIASNHKSYLNANARMNLLSVIESSTSQEDYKRIEYLLQNQITGAGAYEFNRTKKIIGISTIGNKNNWNIAVVAAQDDVMKQTKHIMNMVVVLVSALMLFVAGAFTYFYILNRKYSEEKITSRVNAEKLKMKDAFIANVSHEIRSPMNAIIGMIYFLKSTELTRTQQSHLQKIESAAEILLGIINDILDIAKISSDKLKLRTAPFRFGEVIQTVDDLFGERIRLKGIDWRIRAQTSGDPEIIGDKQRLLQVLVNLVGNAHKFTDRGRIEFIVAADAANDSTINYKITVKDTGIGIAAEDIPKLFTPFEQLETSRNRFFEGTGLGLSICKRLLEMMNGTLDVESKKGQGSAFKCSVSFPIGGRQSGVSGKKPESKRPETFKNARVLLVEDSEINAEIAGMLLDELGVSYDWAPDGRSAVERCRSASASAYQLILMDIHMPVLDGYSAAKIIRRELKAKTKIIALTATLCDQSEIGKNDACIDGYILKPFQAEKFKQVVREALIYPKIRGLP